MHWWVCVRDLSMAEIHNVSVTSSYFLQMPGPTVHVTTFSFASLNIQCDQTALIRKLPNNDQSFRGGQCVSTFNFLRVLWEIQSALNGLLVVQLFLVQPCLSCYYLNCYWSPFSGEEYIWKMINALALWFSHSFLPPSWRANSRKARCLPLISEKKKKMLQRRHSKPLDLFSPYSLHFSKVRM